MKKRVLALTALSSLLFSAGSLAAPSAEIKVIGELVTPSCDVTMPQNGVIDYGEISHTKVDANGPVSLGSKGGWIVDVKCSSETPLTFRVTDNRLGTASETGSKNFGLGNVNTTGKLGYYRITAAAPRIDGKTSYLFVTANNTVTPSAGSVEFEHGKRVGWANNTASTELAIGKEFSFMLATEAFLAKRSDMHGGINEDTNLDGSATLEFGFGL